MKPKKRNPEEKKAAIIKAARRLFARLDIAAVSYRDIAKAAGVSHGLVQRHFGARRHMIAAIIQNEIEEFGKSPSPTAIGSADLTPEILRSELKARLMRFGDFARVITRAELADVKPEELLDLSTPTPAMAFAESIRHLQAKSPAPDRLDPRVVSAYINASLFAFATLSPWLMKSVGLEPKDYEAKLDEIIEISVRLAFLGAGEMKP